MSRCDACGAEGAVQSPWTEVLCPPCTQRQAIDFAASEHLRHVLRIAFKQWHATWSDHPATVRFATDEAGLAAQDVMDEVIGETRPRRNLKLRKTG